MHRLPNSMAQAPSGQRTHSSGERKALEQLQNLGLIVLHVKTTATEPSEHRVSCDT